MRITATVNLARLALGVGLFAAILVVSSPAHASTIDFSSSCGSGTSCIFPDVTLTSIGGSFTPKTIAGYTGIGVTGGRTGDEIDDNGEGINAAFNSQVQLTGFRLLFIYNGPEFGDPHEIAKVTLTTPSGPVIGNFVVGIDNQGSWALGANAPVTIATCTAGAGQDSSTTDHGAGCFDISLLAIVTGVKFEATSAPGWTGSNNSDYNLGSLSYEKLGRDFTPVPEPASMLLLGTGIAGVLARRRKQRS